MEENNIGYLVAWLALGGLFAGFLFWKLLTESKIKKQALVLKNNNPPIIVEIIKINVSNKGIISGIEFTYSNEGNFVKESFVPRKFLSEITALSIELGSAKLYVKNIKKHEPAYLEVGSYSSWGYIGPMFG